MSIACILTEQLAAFEFLQKVSNKIIFEIDVSMLACLILNHLFLVIYIYFPAI